MCRWGWGFVLSYIGWSQYAGFAISGPIGVERLIGKGWRMWDAVWERNEVSFESFVVFGRKSSVFTRDWLLFPFSERLWNGMSEVMLLTLTGASRFEAETYLVTSVLASCMGTVICKCQSLFYLSSECTYLEEVQSLVLPNLCKFSSSYVPFWMLSNEAVSRKSSNRSKSCRNKSCVCIIRDTSTTNSKLRVSPFTDNLALL